MLDFMYFRWSENVELERPDRQSNDFWSMQTDGSSIETKEIALLWQYWDANPGFSIGSGKRYVTSRTMSWQTNLLLSIVSSISLKSNLRYVIYFRPLFINQIIWSIFLYGDIFECFIKKWWINKIWTWIKSYKVYSWSY